MITNKRGIIIVGILLAAGGGVLVWVLSERSPVEPVYEGKRLSEWMEGHTGHSGNYGKPEWKKADEVVRKVGTNGTPTLLRMIRAHDSRWKLKLVGLAQKQNIIRIRHRYALPQNEEAEYAFSVLGASASNAVAELIRIYEANVSPSSRRCAALALGSIGRPAKAAVPALVRNFAHTNADVRFYAVSAVYYIGGEPETVVPALKSVLKDPRKGTRWNAALALGNYGYQARSAIPDLVEALQDETIKEQVEKTLWGVAPDVIAKSFVVEEATPLITNGVTAETLGRNFAGKWVSLIPAGAAVPTAAYQGWGSDPDSQLQIQLGLYRGRAKTLKDNYFLGEFEVIGIPGPPASAHVQIAYLIVSNRIVLCAYEDRGRTFLEIRRVDKKSAK